MSEDGSKKPVPVVPVAPVPEPQAGVPRSGSGADTALDAMIRKRKMGVGAEPPAPSGDARRKPRKK
jgi:hypothetical protein